jgi:hypothetical protein
LLLTAGCGTKHYIVDKTDGISKNESRSIAVEYMGGVEPCGFKENYDTWRWDFRVERPGYETAEKHLYVHKMDGHVVEGIK